MTPEQYKKLPKYARSYIKETAFERDQALIKIEKLEAYIKGMYPEGTNTFINTYPDKTPLPNCSDILFDDGKVCFTARLRGTGELEIFCDVRTRSQEMLIKPIVSNHIIIRSV